MAQICTQSSGNWQTDESVLSSRLLINIRKRIARTIDPRGTQENKGTGSEPNTVNQFWHSCR